MSDTPRTDRVSRNCNGWHHVPIEIARELERELAAVTKERDEANEKASRIGTAFAQFASRVGASLDSVGIKEDELGNRVDAAIARIKRLEEAGLELAEDMTAEARRFNECAKNHSGKNEGAQAVADRAAEMLLRFAAQAKEAR